MFGAAAPREVDRGAIRPDDLGQQIGVERLAQNAAGAEPSRQFFKCGKLDGSGALGVVKIGPLV
jgi:hypothetical protein